MSIHFSHKIREQQKHTGSTFGGVNIASKFNRFPTNFTSCIRREGHRIRRYDGYLLKGRLKISKQSVEISRSHHKVTRESSPIKRQVLNVRFDVASNPVSLSHTYQRAQCEVHITPYSLKKVLAMHRIRLYDEFYLPL